MKVRYLNNPTRTAFTNELNIGSYGEVILYFDADDATSEYVTELEVLLKDPVSSSRHRANTWVPLAAALRSHDVVLDKYERHFREPVNEAEKANGRMGVGKPGPSVERVNLP